MSETAPAASPQTEKKARVKRSWTKVTASVGEQVQTFWPTPEGLHMRKKGSPTVRTCAWTEVFLALNGGRHTFEHDNRTYEVWREVDGIHIQRIGHEQHAVKWAQFIEWIDGQKLLPLV